jgi:hypothetical protein
MIIKTTWQFKKKLKQDKSIWNKNRACAKGYKSRYPENTTSKLLVWLQNGHHCGNGNWNLSVLIGRS